MQENLENYLDFRKFGTPQSGLDLVPKLPPLPSFSNHEITNSSLDTIECQLKIRKYLVSEGPFFLTKGFIHWLTQLHTPLRHYGAKYLVFVSSCSVKMRELSFAQFVNFLRKLCLFSNFWMIEFTNMFCLT